MAAVVATAAQLAALVSLALRLHWGLPCSPCHRCILLPAAPAETDGKVVRTLVKLTLFRQFYIMVRRGLPAKVVHGMRC